MNTFLAVGVALLACLQARLTVALDLNGQLSLSERSSLAYRLNESGEATELELTFAHERHEPSLRPDEQLHVWILTRDGGSLPKTRELQSEVGISNAGYDNDRFTAKFEKAPASNIVAIVVAVRDRVLCFDGSRPERRNPFSPITLTGKQRYWLPREVALGRPFPDGEYNLTLEWWHGHQEASLQVKGGRAKVIRANDDRVMGMTGEFGAEGAKDYSISFRTDAGETATQHWIAQPDGTFTIKEIPDRGEKESAVPVAKSAAIPPPPSDIVVLSARSNLPVVNGGFDAGVSPDRTGSFGEPKFSPGSTRLPGWSVADGVVCLRITPPSPAGGFVLELGPHSDPGTVSQTIRTEPGKAYELAFFACAGRNDTLKVRLANVERTIVCGSTFERVSIPFKAAGPETTVRFSGVGSEGFGPMIDDVQITQRNPLGEAPNSLNLQRAQ